MTSATVRRQWPDLPGIPDCPRLPLTPVRQQFPNASDIKDLDGVVARAVDALVPDGARRRVAVCVGSRGIARIDRIVRVAVRRLRALGWQPVIVPAMGSHGGATPSGQEEVLAHLDITEESAGAPIDASTDVELVGRLANGAPVYTATSARRCEGILLINRIRPHTDFHGDFESGLAKMAAIGLGKRPGAEALHALGVDGLRTWMPEAARLVVHRSRVVGAIGVIEHARHDVAEIDAVPPDGIGGPLEAALLGRARELQARLPFDAADVLVVGSIGKDISGTGMDTNVIGRMAISGEPEPASPRIAMIVALRLSEGSGGNGHGVGLADLVTAELAGAIDFATTYVNSLTSGIGGIQRGRLPPVLPTDRAAIAAAIACAGWAGADDVKLALIADTLHVDRLFVTESLRVASTRVIVDGDAVPLEFDAGGRLASPKLRELAAAGDAERLV